MPRPLPPLHSRFKPGQSGNPAGTPKNFLTRSKVKALIDKYLSCNQSELEAFIIDKNKTPALELMIISTILYCIKAGDYSRLEALLSRAVGKVRDEIEEDINPNSEEQVSKLSLNELLTLVKTTQEISK